MAFVNIGYRTWDDSPKIKLTFDYERRRSGADMQYRIRTTIDPLEYAESHFGYPIYCKISLSGKLRINGHKLKGNSPSHWSSPIIYTTDWLTVEDRATGTVSMSIEVYSKSYGRSRTYSYSLAVDPGASWISANRAELGGRVTIEIHRYFSEATHTVTYRVGEATGTITTKSPSTSMIWNPPKELARQNTRGTTLSCTLSVKTYDGAGRTCGDSKSCTITLDIPSDIKPSAKLTLSDPEGHSSKYGGYVQGQSKLKAVLTGTGSYGSAIRGYQINARSLTTTDDTLTVSLPYSGSVTVSGKVTDTRSRSRSTTAEITVLAYQPPKVTSLSESRCNASGTTQHDGDHCRVRFSGVGYWLDGKNPVKYYAQWRVTGTTSWSEKFVTDTTDPSGATAVFTADVATAYEVRVRATDSFGSRYSAIHILPPAYDIINVSPSGKGLGFGQKAGADGTLGIGLDTDFNGDLRVGGKSLVTWSSIPISPGSGSGYSVTIPRESSKILLGLGLAVINMRLVLKITSQQNAGTEMTLATIDAGYRPAGNTPLAMYIYSTNSRRYMGLIESAGSILMRPSTLMPTGEYSLYVTAVYLI